MAGEVKSSYDVVVIGAGIAGLTAATSLAVEGHSVLLLERGRTLGGCCTTFRRRGFYFDSAVHHICGADRYSNFGRILEALGVELEWIQVDPLDTLVFSDQEFVLPTMIPALREALTAVYPAQKENIRAVLRSLRHAYRAMRRSAPEDQSLLQRLATRSYDELLRDHIDDARCRRILSGQWPYIGVPPKRLGALEGLMNIGGYLFQGAHYPRGGCQKLANALGQRLEELGGKVLLRTAPRRVLVQGGAICGVEVGPEQVVKTSCVVSAMDVGRLLDILPAEEAPLLRAQREQLRPSVSAFLLYLGFSRQADLRPIPWGQHFFEEDFADWEGWMFLANPTASDPDLAANEGQILCCVLPYAGPYGPEQDWHAQKAQVAEKVLTYMEGRSPGLRQHLEVMETASPSTIWRYTGNQQGAIYGWAATVEQSGPRRMQPQTEVTGLFLAGHWTTPSSGVPGVAASGMLTAGLASDFLQP